MVERGRPEEEIGAHVEGHNATTIGVCYAGGLDDHGKPADTRTPAQEAAMLRLVVGLKAKYPGARIVGHRDLSPDTNHNGRVDKWEWLKDCPCFEVADWAAARGLK
jgi:N-acetyl-anhydromuramyl-L-alanine amidase AmpD